MIIRYSDGSGAVALIHRLEHGIMRATVAGIDDAVDYVLFEDGWTSETGDDVAFEFTQPGDVDAMRGAGEPGCAAAGGCILRRIPGTGPVLVN